jgi:tRNA(Ile2) C34 agmatinyltransferase TiaS
VTSRRHHLRALCALLERGGERTLAAAERCRDEYLRSLDADDGLVVLQIDVEEVLSAWQPDPRRPQCGRCGARLSTKRHRCSRCGLPCRP